MNLCEQVIDSLYARTNVYARKRKKEKDARRKLKKSTRGRGNMEKGGKQVDHKN